jgi:cysteine-rich repeat protein
MIKGTGLPYQFYLAATTGRLSFYSDVSGPVTSSTPVTAGAWQHVAITVDNDLSEVKFYINGSQVGTTQAGNLDADDGSDVQIGAFNATNYFDGMMDDVRLSQAVRSADWIATSYANQNDPSTFYNVGTEETFGGEPVVSNPVPSDGATDVSVSLSELRFTLTDNEGDLMDYTVSTSPDIGSDSATGVSDGEYVLAVSGLAYDTTYTWYVDASDPAGSGGTTNAVFSFTTETAPGGWWNLNWHYRKSITIDHTQVAEELINFPLLVSLADAELGAQAQADGDDIVFTDYLGVPLDHELEYCSAGDLVAWVRIPLLPADVDTALFMYYGNATAPNQENATGVWDAAYDMVHHLSETSGTHFDSTINGRDGTPSGGANQSAVGLMDGADGFQTPEQYIGGTSFSVGNVYTYSMWFNANTLAYADPRGDWNCLFELAANNTNRIILWTLKDPDPATTAELYVSHQVPVVTTNAAINAGQWYYAVFTFDFSASPQARMYVNGLPVSLTQDTGLPATPTVAPGIFRIGTDTFQSPDFTLDGRIDEVRFAERVHSPGWVLTEYNNQWSPSTFYDVGSEENNLAVCGNSIVDFGEDCDDGNTFDGDCCSSLCLYEPPGSPCGDQSDASCDHPDTCDGAGTCLDNLEPDATPCEDGQFCTVGQTCQSGSCQGGTDPCTNPELPHCDEQSDQCVECLINDHCADGVFCDGAEQCVDGTCETDGAPCDDGVACTNDSCDEASNTCTNIPNDANCDDGLFCNGPETCNALSGCQSGAAPCTEPTPICDEINDVCLAECFTNDDCDDGNVCTWGTCEAGECAYSIRPYGDVDRNLTLSLFDVFCLLDLIAGETPDDPNCARSTADIEPCAGNGVVSLLDVFAVLEAVGGTDPCCSGVSLGRDLKQSGKNGNSISNLNETPAGVHR